MDFMDQLRALAKRVVKEGGNVAAEQENGNAYVVPFIQALGYDVFDPTEVLENFAVDTGSGMEERIDYAILFDNEPALLIECAAGDSALREGHLARLRRCFSAVSAQIGVLTDGKSYSFYSDREKLHVMDAEPFMKIDLLNLDEKTILALEKLSKSTLKLDEMFAPARRVHYIQAMKEMLLEQSAAPSVACIRCFARRLDLGMVTANMVGRLVPLAEEAFRQCVEAYNSDGGIVNQPGHPPQITDEEFEGFFVVDVTQ